MAGLLVLIKDDSKAVQMVLLMELSRDVKMDIPKVVRKEMRWEIKLVAELGQQMVGQKEYLAVVQRDEKWVGLSVAGKVFPAVVEMDNASVEMKVCKQAELKAVQMAFYRVDMQVECQES